MALVIDQSLTQDNMERVNSALGALQGAFAPYDEMARDTHPTSPVPFPRAPRQRDGAQRASEQI